MKKVTALLLLSVCSIQQSCSSNDIDLNPNEQQEKTVFKEEFDSFNANVWTKEVHEAGWTNQELQAYDEAHVSVGKDDGKSVLILTAERKGNKIISGRVNSKGKRALNTEGLKPASKFPKQPTAYGRHFG
jgi:hypothetical protein